MRKQSCSIAYVQLQTLTFSSASNKGMEEDNILPKEIEVKLGASSYERESSGKRNRKPDKALSEKGDDGKIRKMIRYLGDEYVRSHN